MSSRRTNEFCEMRGSALYVWLILNLQGEYLEEHKWCSYEYCCNCNVNKVIQVRSNVRCLLSNGSS